MATVSKSEINLKKKKNLKILKLSINSFLIQHKKKIYSSYFTKQFEYFWLSHIIQIAEETKGK